jgi:hypothetical protein
MHQSIRTRLEALERRVPSADTVDTILVSFVAPSSNGPVRREPIAIREMRGEWRLDRSPGEEVEAFRERASRLCPRQVNGVALLAEVIE